LVILKPLATSLTLGSGNSGGVFAPALFTGAALGGAFGGIVERFAPGMTGGPGIFAVVGMAAVFAGAARAPFTAILIVVEMTNDYRVIVPLMAGVIVSVIVADRLQKESIYTLKLVRRGIPLWRGHDVDVMQAVSVGEVMVSKPVTVPVNMPVMLLPGEFLRTGRHGFPVIDTDGSLYGVVSLDDYRKLSMGQKAPPENLVVGDIATRDMLTVFPDDTVGTALRRMAPRDLSRVPVVSREDPRRLVGVVRRNDIVRAYEVGVVRREEARRRADAVETVRDSHAEFLDIPIPPDSAVIGKTVAELKLPRAAVLVSIRRGDELIIPHGDTCLLAGDVVTTLCEHLFASDVQAALA
jgi:CIC family chloride channel protein